MWKRITLQDYFVNNLALKDQWAMDLNAASPAALRPSSRDKVWWRCDRGHEWQAAVESRVWAGRGCAYCANQIVIPCETDIATAAPEMAKLWHPTRNGNLNPTDISPGSRKMIWWKCELGQSWNAEVFSRTRGKAAGCPYCTGRLVLPGFHDLATLKPELAEEWYAPLNGDLKPEDVSLGSHKKVWRQCGEGHVWQAYIYARAKPNGTGCPVCAGVVKRRRHPKISPKKNRANLREGGKKPRADVQISV